MNSLIFCAAECWIVAVCCGFLTANLKHDRGMGVVPFFRLRLVLWRLIPFAIFWSFWKERNARVFNGSSMPKEDILSLVLMCIAKWISVRKEFDSLRVEGIFHNWKRPFTAEGRRRD